MAETGHRGPRPSRPQNFAPRRRPFDAGAAEGIDRQRLAELENEEPLSFAEELDKAAERVRRVGNQIERTDKPDANIHIAALQKMAMPELIQLTKIPPKIANSLFILVLLSSEPGLPLLCPHPRHDGPSLSGVTDATPVHVPRRGRD